jgi:hypothetical protein
MKNAKPGMWACRRGWADRPDRTSASCTFAQFDQPVSFDLNDIVPGLR